jgi:hypothetical protein
MNLDMSGGRTSLHFQASWWRLLGKVGTWIHRLPTLRPAIPQLIRPVNNTTATESSSGTEDYEQRMNGKRFLVIVNFHGGGGFP